MIWVHKTIDAYESWLLQTISCIRLLRWSFGSIGKFMRSGKVTHTKDTSKSEVLILYHEVRTPQFRRMRLILMSNYFCVTLWLFTSAITSIQHTRNLNSWLIVSNIGSCGKSGCWAQLVGLHWKLVGFEWFWRKGQFLRCPLSFLMASKMVGERGVGMRGRLTWLHNLYSPSDIDVWQYQLHVASCELRSSTSPWVLGCGSKIYQRLSYAPRVYLYTLANMTHGTSVSGHSTTTPFLEVAAPGYVAESSSQRAVETGAQQHGLCLWGMWGVACLGHISPCLFNTFWGTGTLGFLGPRLCFPLASYL